MKTTLTFVFILWINLSYSKNFKKPILFMENWGQVVDAEGRERKDVLFASRLGNMQIYFTGNSILYQFVKGEADVDLNNKDFTHLKDEKLEMCAFEMKLLGASLNPECNKKTKEAYYENYYNIDGHPEGITKVPSYSDLVFSNVYPGIDWHIYSSGEGLKYDFIVHPGADPYIIQLDYINAINVESIDNGAIKVSTPLGAVTEKRPVAFEYGSNKNVRANWNLKNKIASFTIGDYDKSKTLIIDPYVIWGTYSGGFSFDMLTKVDSDNPALIYVAGVYGSASMVSGGTQVIYGGSIDSYFACLDSAGNYLWSSYYGGGGTEATRGFAVKGNLIALCGNTTSSNNIFYQGYQGAGSSGNGYLALFDIAGVRRWGTYLGGQSDDVLASVTFNNDSKIWAVGWSESNGLASAGANQGANHGMSDGIIAKFDTTGAMNYISYFGGPSHDKFYGVTLNTTTNGIFVCGETNSLTDIAYNAYDSTFGGLIDGLYASFNGNGGLVWSSYYGGNSEDRMYGIEFEQPNNCYVVGKTYSTNLALNAYQSTIVGSADGYLFHYDDTGNPLWATYFGGNDWELLEAISIDSSGIYIGGITWGSSGLNINGLYNTQGSTDGLVVSFERNGTLRWSSYYGGPDEETVAGLYSDGVGHVYLVGNTKSLTGIAYNGYQMNLAGTDVDGYIAKLDYSYVVASIDQISNNEQFILYPNPAKEEVTLKFKHDLEFTEVKIYDSIGKEIFASINKQDKDLIIDLRNVENGFYTVICESANFRSSGKLVVNR